jgi:hypothetical protein
MKYAFNHDENSISGVTGISDQRINELAKAAQKTVMAAYFVDDAISDTGRALEMLINEGDPQTVVEALVLGQMFGKAEGKMKEVAKKLKEFSL